MIWRYAAFAWLALLTGLNVYRAITWSITIDEARVFLDYLGSPSKVFSASYDPCNHVLQTWLSSLAVALLGRAEWVIRLPSLIAGLFYFGAVWKLSRMLVGEGGRHLLAVVVLSANPLILDHLSLGRGYGLALTLFAWAFYHLLLALENDDVRRISYAGYLLSLAIAANLVFVVPVTAILTIFAIAWWRPGAAGVLIDRLLLPTVVPAFLIVVIPLSKTAAGQFIFGERNLYASWNTLVSSSLAAFSPETPAWIGPIEKWVLPILAILIVAMGAAAWRRMETAAARALFLAVGTLLLSHAAWIVAHQSVGVLYPGWRYAIYWIWLFLFACVAAWKVASMRALAWVFAALLVAVGVRFTIELGTGFYYEFPDHAEVKQAIQQIRTLHGNLPTKVQIGCSWEYDCPLNYYRQKNRLRWMEPADRKGEVPGRDVYVLRAQDAAWMDRLHLKRVWTGPRTGVIVAVPSVDIR
ncbi:MAG TPA: glycosyltransferase family 39 protein [Bryobacteraceae bacterium]|nr:glycosyltransferase family 39 protein [Bryobacteraceae bacterium]